MSIRLGVRRIGLVEHCIIIIIVNLDGSDGEARLVRAHPLRSYLALNSRFASSCLVLLSRVVGQIRCKFVPSSKNILHRSLGVARAEQMTTISFEHTRVELFEMRNMSTADAFISLARLPCEQHYDMCVYVQR